MEKARDWNNPVRSKLWLYNLHYFDDLIAKSATDRVEWHRALISRWVEENPPPEGNGWEPYPTSLRIVNWIKWALAGNSLEVNWVHSMAVQVRWLHRRIEWHLLGNHLIANAKALVFAGLFFDGAEPRGWLKSGLQILGRELPEQIRPDGGHFEQSPMYHAIILEDLLDLVNASGVWPGSVPDEIENSWREMAARMLRWLNGLTHPDGGIAFFNDSAFGIASDHAGLEAYGARLNCFEPEDFRNPHVMHFADSGYVRLENESAVALLDVAEVGAPYLPGHAHADTLSFELSVCGQRVLVNSGTSQYGLGEERLRQRGTSAHNTVTVDGRNSSEVWGGFRVGSRAHPFDFEIANEDGTIIVRCSHDGYRSLPGRVVHAREWRFASNDLLIRDHLHGVFSAALVRFHLHPEIEVLADQGLRMPNGKCITWSSSGGTSSIVDSTWHPEFGISMKSRCIEILLREPEVSVQFQW